MSTKLALSCALSVLLMAGFTLFGEHAVQRAQSSAAILGVPAESQMLRLPALPNLPGLR